MRTRLCATLGLAASVLAAAGCVSLKRTPEARFFVLQSLVAPPPGPLEPVGIVGVEPAVLPGHLERPQLVVWTGPNELKTDEFLRWAEPLKDGITRTLAEDLAGLMPDHQIVRRPWEGSVRTRCRVRVLLRTFGLQRDGRVRLEGEYRLLPDEGALARVQRPVSLSEGPLPIPADSEAPAGAEVEAMNKLLEKLSREIAASIRALPPEVDVVEETADAIEREDEAVVLEDDAVESQAIENR
jgi:uncharacterized lipoprotein YmbA